MAKVTGSTAAKALHSAGFRGWTIPMMIAIGYAESGLNATARNHTSREDSRGVWQINVDAHPWARSWSLYSVRVNARAARRVYLGAGSSFRPWSVYLHCTYVGHLHRAIDDWRISGTGYTKTSADTAIRHTIRHCDIDLQGAVETALNLATAALRKFAAPLVPSDHIKVVGDSADRSAKLVQAHARAGYAEITKRL